jgi:hypothetical protein
MVTHIRKCFAPRILVLVAIALSAVAVGFGLGTARAADPNLDLADAALEKAYVLVDLSQTGGVSPKQQKEFDKAIADALKEIAAARADIAAAKAAVDIP